MNVDIVFDEKYPYTSDHFAINLQEALKRGGYHLKKLRYAKIGETGHIKVNNEDADISHPIQALIRKAEQWTDNEGTSVVF